MQTMTFALIGMALFAIAAAEMYGYRYGYGKRAAGFEDEAREKREMYGYRYGYGKRAAGFEEAREKREM